MGIPLREKKRFALIGCPLGHSISPFIHAELQKRAGIIADYELIETDKSELEKCFENTLCALDGFNVTIPHKTDIIPLLDSVSKRAELFGSVNTVSVKNGKTKGYNTDCTGFLRALGGAELDLKGSVLILGCGGVSRMFLFESAIAGADITLAVRRSGLLKAESLRNELMEKLNCDFKVTELDKVDKGYDLIINGTPVGMYPNTESSPLCEKAVSLSKAVFDAVYNPAETKLIKFAKQNGLKYLNGLPMLVWQAAAAEEIWNDTEFSEKEIEEVIRLSEEYMKNE